MLPLHPLQALFGQLRGLHFLHTVRSRTFRVELFPLFSIFLFSFLVLQSILCPWPGVKVLERGWKRALGKRAKQSSFFFSMYGSALTQIG